MEISTQTARRIATRHYGLEGELEELPAESDHNFLVRAGQQRFVLKISRRPRSELEFENRVLERLAASRQQARFPRARASLSGEQVVEDDAGGEPCRVRLLDFLPGTLLARFRPHSPELMESLGGVLGGLDSELAGLQEGPAAAGKWDLARSDWIGEHLPEIEGPGRRKLVEARLARFLDLRDSLSLFPGSLIHNDANDHNVLVGRREDAWRVTGLIDFGDMQRNCRIFEPAVAAAYAMLDKEDPLAAAARLAAGYHAVLPLEEREIELLFDLIAMRLAVSVTNAGQQRRVRPGNPYLLVSEEPAWRLLEQMEGIHPDFAHAVFRHACGLEPSPHRRQVAARIEACEVHPVVAGLGEGVPVLDLSVSCPDAEAWPEPGEELALGRYDEPRLCYRKESFLVGSEPEQYRTVHIGIDIFAPPGTAVMAPLAGRVHSFADNSRPGDYGPAVILEHETDQAVFYTLYGHLSRDSLEDLREGRSLQAGEAVGRIGTKEENGGWPPHLHFQLITRMLGLRGDFPGAAAPAQRDVWLSLCPDPNLILRLSQLEQPEEGDLSRRRRRHLGPSLSLSYRLPLEIVRGFGCRLWDGSGRCYLDCVNNVPHVGHCHPRVAAAVSRQTRLLNTNTRYLHRNLVRYAERLTATLPEPLSVCYLVCSGSEANELALRLARSRTGSRRTLVIDGAYHGNTSALVEISPYKFDGPGGRGAAPHVHKVLRPDPYRGVFRDREPQGELYAGDVREKARAAAKRGAPTFIYESVMGCAGQIFFPDGYLVAAQRAVHDAGGVSIADEIQIGFGRVGEAFWGFELQGVVPDIVTLGKPIGNGYPLGAVVTTPEIAEAFDPGMEYFNTFGGNPVACAAGLAVLEVIEREGLQENALRVGARLKSALEELAARFPLIGDVRGRGLFLGVELVTDPGARTPAPHQAAHVVERMKEQGILLSTDGPDCNVIKIKPPLVFSAGDADRLVATLARVLEEDPAQPLACAGGAR